MLTKPGSREELPAEVLKAIAEVKAHGFGRVLINIRDHQIVTWEAAKTGMPEKAEPPRA